MIEVNGKKVQVTYGHFDGLWQEVTTRTKGTYITDLLPTSFLAHLDHISEINGGANVDFVWVHNEDGQHAIAITWPGEVGGFNKKLGRHIALARLAIFENTPLKESTKTIREVNPETGKKEVIGHIVHIRQSTAMVNREHGEYKIFQEE